MGDIIENPSLAIRQATRQASADSCVVVSEQADSGAHAAHQRYLALCESGRVSSASAAAGVAKVTHRIAASATAGVNNDARRGTTAVAAIAARVRSSAEESVAIKLALGALYGQMLLLQRQMYIMTAHCGAPIAQPLTMASAQSFTTGQMLRSMSDAARAMQDGAATLCAQLVALGDAQNAGLSAARQLEAAFAIEGPAPAELRATAEYTAECDLSGWARVLGAVTDTAAQLTDAEVEQEH
jgi:hypothetical protein